MKRILCILGAVAIPPVAVVVLIALVIGVGTFVAPMLDYFMGFDRSHVIGDYVVAGTIGLIGICFVISIWLKFSRELYILCVEAKEKGRSK